MFKSRETYAAHDSPSPITMAQQQLSNSFHGAIFEDLGMDIYKKEIPPPPPCPGCERMCCICEMNTSSSLTLNSEDSLSQREDSPPSRYFSASEEEVEEEGRKRAQKNYDVDVDQICWEEWREKYDGGKDAEQARDRQMRAQRSANRGDVASEVYAKDPCWSSPIQSPIGEGGVRVTTTRPIMLHPRSLFDSDLKVFFLRSLRDVKVCAGTETLLSTDIEFHPFMTEQGVQAATLWTASVSPIPQSSPYFTETLSFCAVKGGTVDLCLHTTKPLVVSAINGSNHHDAHIWAGTVIGVLELCIHRY